MLYDKMAAQFKLQGRYDKAVASLEKAIALREAIVSISSSKLRQLEGRSGCRMTQPNHKQCLSLRLLFNPQS